MLNAYRHNADAALKACSWGKFQIMGDEHQSSCGVKLNVFMTDMCTSEVKQIELFRRFIEHKAGGRLLKAVRRKDWANMARYYNGSGNVEHYADLLRKAYEKIKKEVA